MMEAFPFLVPYKLFLKLGLLSHYSSVGVHLVEPASTNCSYEEEQHLFYHCKDDLSMVRMHDTVVSTFPNVKIGLVFEKEYLSAS